MSAHKQDHEDLEFGNVKLIDIMKIDLFQAGIKNAQLRTNIRGMSQNPSIIGYFEKFTSALGANVAWESPKVVHSML